MPVHRLVDAVVEDFPDEVMQAGRADAADVHAGPLPDRLQAFQDRDVFGGVVGGCHVYNVRLARSGPVDRSAGSWEPRRTRRVNPAIRVAQGTPSVGQGFSSGPPRPPW